MKNCLKFPAPSLLLLGAWLLLAIAMMSCSVSAETPKQEDQTSSEILALPYYSTPDFTPQWLNPNDPQYNSQHTIAPFSFENQDGETVTNATFENKLYIANFFFTTCPGICPKMTVNMSALQEAFQDNEEVLLLSHTVTPWIDDVPKLKDFAQDKGVISGKWHLVTGEKEEIYTLARQSYFAEEEPGISKETEQFLHTEHFLLIDGKGRIRGIYNGTLELETERLIEDVATLMLESA